MSTEKASIPLREFFSALERRLEKQFPGTWPAFRVRICGRLIELRFVSERDAKIAVQSLKGMVTADRRQPDAVFKCWSDNCARYIGAENAAANWWKKDETGCISHGFECGFFAGDMSRGVFYSCLEPALGHDLMLGCHALHTSFYQWARGEDKLMVHAACVGVNGRGVLIAGRGGAGKSTLSTSCLLSGLEFVSDDYTLLTGSGPLDAMPLYTTISLCEDMFRRLQPQMQVMGTVWKGKLELDASAYPFASRLAVRGLILPGLGSKDPQIVQVPPERPVTRMIHSTVGQAGVWHDPEPVRTMAARLRGVPAFEFRQCADLQKNAEFLRQFIEKEL